MRLTIRPADTSTAELETIAAIVNISSPDEPTSVDDMRWGDATYPGGERRIAEVDGVAVGVGTVGRIYVHPPEYDAYWGTIDVLPGARRHGVGSALLAEIRSLAAAAGKGFLHMPASEARPEGISFLLHRGFEEFERGKAVYLDLAGLASPTPTPPEGVTLTTLADRPDLVEGVHAVALATFEDIPGGDEPMAVGDLAEFRARDVDRVTMPKWGFIVALDEAAGEVIGYASLAFAPGSSTVAWHDMTAVVRPWRGRGLATTLKQAQIAVAIDHGLATLETYNDEDNAGMRSLNARLGYLARPDALTMRGSVERGIMER